MMKNMAAALVALIGSGVSVAQAETLTFGDLGLTYENYGLSGSAVNSGGSFPNEPERFYAGRIDGSYGMVYGNGLAWSVKGHFLETSVPDFLAPGEASNEGVGTAAQIVGTFGRYSDGFYFGGIAGLGQVGYVGNDVDQSTDYRLFGLGAGFEEGRWAFGGSVATMNIASTDDAETLNNAVMFRAQAEYELAADRSYVGAYLLFGNGDNDSDLPANAIDPVNGKGFGIYARHKVARLWDRNDVLLTGGAEYWDLTEDNASGSSTDVFAMKAYIGVSITFGNSATPRAMRVAQVADSTFLQMATPYVD